MKSDTILLLCIFFAALLTGCSRARNDADDEERAITARVPVTLGTITNGTIETEVTATGMTEALRRQKILSPVAGRITSISVQDGTPVRKGDILLSIRTKESQASIEGAQMLLQSAVTDQQKEEARQALRLADSLQPSVAVRARFDGIIASRTAMEGEIVAEQTELLTMVDPSSVVFVAEIPSSDLPAVRKQQHARVVFPNIGPESYPAVVDAINPLTDSDNQSIRVRLTFVRPVTGLKPGLLGTANIITGSRRDVLLAAAKAVLRDDANDTYSVITMTADSLSLGVPVTIGARNDSLVEVISPLLRPGCVVIMQGQYSLADSTRVTTVRP